MELKAADTLSDISHLPPARCHEMTGNRAGQFSVDLEHPYRLLFVPANAPIPCPEGGGFDREQVTEIEIIEVADTH
jgi:proteic killer suppression protein